MLLSGLLNSKTALIAGLALSLAGGIWLHGCDYGDGKGHARGVAEKQEEVDKWRKQYLDLRDAPPKTEIKVVTKYVTLPRRVDTVAIAVDTPEEKISAPYHVESAGTIQAAYLPMAPIDGRFRFNFIPDVIKVDTVYVIETRTALEYVEVSVFEQAEFYIMTVIAAVGGYALAGGF